MPEELDEGGVVGIGGLFAMIMSFASQDVGADLGERVKDRDVAARSFLERLGRVVDLGERARCALDGADDRLDMPMLLCGGQDLASVITECLFQCGIRRGGDDGIEVGTRGDLGEIGRGSMESCERGEKEGGEKSGADHVLSSWFIVLCSLFLAHLLGISATVR